MQALTRIKSIVKRIVKKAKSFRVQINVPKEIIGTNYGGWCICPSLINCGSIIYSFGIGEDISFDLGVIEKYKANIYAFDPTPKSINWVKSQSLPEKFRLFEYGLADFDGTAQFNPPENPDHVSHTLLDRPSTSDKAIQVQVCKLATIMQKLGHGHLDILKMDIEGAEFSVIKNLVEQDVPVKQILVEFHHHFDNVSFEETKRAIELLNQKGYKIFYISDSELEYSFIKTDLVLPPANGLR